MESPRVCPDLASRVARDQVLEFVVERRLALYLAVDVGIAQHRTAHLHAGIVTVALCHGLDSLSGSAMFMVDSFGETSVQTRSMTKAMPWPTPMHIVAKP